MNLAAKRLKRMQRRRPACGQEPAWKRRDEMELISRPPGSRRSLIGYLYTKSFGDEDEDAGYAWVVMGGGVELAR